MSSEVYKVTRETLKYISDGWRIADNPMADNPLDVSYMDIKDLEDGQYLVIWTIASVIHIDGEMKINYHGPMVYSAQNDLKRAEIDKEYLEWTNGLTNHAVIVEIWHVVDKYYDIDNDSYMHNLPHFEYDVIDGNYCVSDKDGLLYLVDTLPLFEDYELDALVDDAYFDFSYYVLVDQMTVRDIYGRRHWLPLKMDEVLIVLDYAARCLSGDGFPF